VLVDLEDEVAVAQGLVDLRNFESLVKEAKAILTDAFRARTQVLGTKTVHLPDGRVASLSAEKEIEYDAEAIEEALRALGMPEERIREIVEERVSYKVRAVEMKRAAGANPEYDRVMQDHSREVEKNVYVQIRRRR
jgi:Arc/MetJ family transcription regulator